MAAEETFGELVPNATSAWLWMLKDVMSRGNFVTVRGLNITEVMHRNCRIDMLHPIINVADRKLGLAFLFAEAAWILSGRNDVRSIAPFAKKISQFSDDGIFFRGAYGPQIIQQMPYILETLKNDIYSRQAVISIWKPSPPPSKDIPCTIDVQFMVRAGLLHTFVHMRSSDCWLGVPYDWFNFSMLSYWLLLILNETLETKLELGFLHFTANSQHIYETDNANVQNILANFGMNAEDPRICGTEEKLFQISNHKKLIDTLWDMAYAELDSNHWLG